MTHFLFRLDDASVMFFSKTNERQDLAKHEHGGNKNKNKQRNTMYHRLRLPLALSFAVTVAFSRVACAKANHTAAAATAFVSSSGKIHINSSSSSTITGAARSATTVLSGEKVNGMTIDHEYPGTAVERMLTVRQRVSELAASEDKPLSGPWADVRRKLLWAGGLRDLPESIPGQGYTGHSFNDYNHVDLTCMQEIVSDNENDGSIQGIALGNRLGPGIRIASLPELGPGGSWSTCSNGSNMDPPQDVAHIQFRSRIAFKLVWIPGTDQQFNTFVLVDDDGKELAQGQPTGRLPPLRQRQLNFVTVQGSKYGKVAEELSKHRAAE